MHMYCMEAYKHARNSSGRLAICVIYINYFMYHTHRSSFPDVLAVTTHHSMISCLPIRSANKQMELCGPQRFHQFDARGSQAAQTKRLVQLGLEHSTLVTYYTGFHGSSEGEGSEKQGPCVSSCPVYQASKASS